MHTYLNTFIEKNFQKYLDQLKKNVYIDDTFDNWTSPAVSITNINHSIINDIKNLSENIFHEFNPNTGANLKEWYSNYRADSWNELVLLNNDETNEIYDFINKKMICSKKNNKVKENTVLLQKCLDLLDIKDSSCIKTLRIATVDPGGFIHPHKDKLSNVRCLWMPLHDFSWCLKFFPFGWLMHEFGNAYLVNNGKYVHGVLNTSRERRYVLNIDFFENLSKDKLLKWHEKSPTNWKDIFTNNLTTQK